MKRKILSCMLIVCLIMTMMPSMAWATGEVPEVNPVELNISDGSIIISDDGYKQGENDLVGWSGDDHSLKIKGTATTANTITVSGGNPTMILDGLQITRNNDVSSSTPVLTIDADATLALVGANTLDSSAAQANAANTRHNIVKVNSGATLSIKDGDNGSLTLKGSMNSAVFTGAGTLHLLSGNVTASGGNGNQTIDIASLILDGGTLDASWTGNSAARAIVVTNLTVNGGALIANAPNTAVTATNFVMTGGYLKSLKSANNKGDLLVTGTVNVTGGNVNGYYNEEIDGRVLTQLYFADADGNPQVEKECTVKESDNTWTAHTNSKGIIVTYLLDATSAVEVNDSSITINDGKAVVGSNCTCSQNPGRFSVDTSAKRITITAEQETAELTYAYQPAESCKLPEGFHGDHEKLDGFTIEKVVQNGKPVKISQYAEIDGNILHVYRDTNLDDYTVYVAGKSKGGVTSEAIAIDVKSVAVDADSRVLDIDEGSVTITATGYKQGNATEETAYTGSYVLTQSSTEQTTDKSIDISGVAENQTITLNGLNMAYSMDRKGAVNVNGGDVKLLLAGSNTLIGGGQQGYAGGLNIVDAAVTIDGTGTLHTTGGQWAAGIHVRDNATLIIDGGNIQATGEKSAAGIGSNYRNHAGTIIINGGVVIAKGGAYANKAYGSGIGGSMNPAGGVSKSAKKVTINGGTVTATGADVNYSSGINANALEINGGAVNLSNMRDNAPVPVNAGGDTVYLHKLYFVDSEGTPLADMQVKVNDWTAMTDAEGILKVYLPEDTDAVSVTYGDMEEPQTVALQDHQALIGGECTCSVVGTITWEAGIPTAVTLFGDTSYNLQSAKVTAVGNCTMPIHLSMPKPAYNLAVTKGEETISVTSAYAVLDGGNLTLKKEYAPYTVTLTAEAGEQSVEHVIDVSKGDAGEAAVIQVTDADNTKVIAEDGGNEKGHVLTGNSKSAILTVNADAQTVKLAQDNADNAWKISRGEGVDSLTVDVSGKAEGKTFVGHSENMVVWTKVEAGQVKFNLNGGNVAINEDGTYRQGVYTFANAKEYVIVGASASDARTITNNSGETVEISVNGETVTIAAGETYTAAQAAGVKYDTDTYAASYLIPNGTDAYKLLVVGDMDTRGLSEYDAAQQQKITEIWLDPDLDALYGHLCYQAPIKRASIEHAKVVGDIFWGSAVENIYLGPQVEQFTWSNYMRQLQKVTVHEDNTAYKTVDGALYTKDGKELLGVPMAKAGDFKVLSSCEIIHPCAFAKSRLKTITLGENVQTVGNRAFEETSLRAIHVPDSNPYLMSKDGVLFSGDGSTLQYYPTAKEDTVYTVPDSVKNIVYMGIFKSAYLEELVLPEGGIVVDQTGMADNYELKRLTLKGNLSGAASSLRNTINLKELVVPEDYNWATNIFNAYSGGVQSAMRWLPDAKVNVETEELVYDGTPKCGVAVTQVLDDVTIEYSMDNETWSSEAPTFTQPGEHTVYFRLNKAADVYTEEERVQQDTLYSIKKSYPLLAGMVNGKYEFARTVYSSATFTIKDIDTPTADWFDFIPAREAGSENMAAGADVTLAVGGVPLTAEGYEVQYYDSEGQLLDAVPETAGTYTVKVNITQELYNLYDLAPIELGTYSITEKGKNVISFVTNGGSAIDTITAEPGAEITVPADPERTGYAFLGWYADSALRTKVDALPEIMPEASAAYYAKWQRETYTITYDNMKDAVTANPTTYTVESNDIVLEAPSVPGYEFMGWTYDDHTEDTAVIKKGSTGDKTFSANWKLEEYTITYKNYVSGTDTYDLTLTKDKGIKLDVPEDRTGYTFAGWQMSNDGVVTIIPLEKGEIPKGTLGNLTISGIWLAEEQTLTLDAGEGAFADGSKTQVITTEYEGGFTMAADPVRTGYDFAGWFEDEACTVPFEAETMPLTMTIYANWTPVVYTITYDGVADAVNNNPAAYTIESEAITLTAPERTGYDFAGWTYEGQEEPVKEVVIEKGSMGNKAYTANWTLVTYTITYGGVAGAVNNNPATTYTIESEAITLAAPTKTGYVFTGWTWAGQTTPVKSVTIPKGSHGNKAYTANWTPVVYTITYGGVAGAVNSNPATYTIETAITLKEPVKAGYVFTGWTYAGQTAPVKTVVIPKGSMGNKAYTANFMMIPAATSKVTTALYGYDDIKVTWSAATGATSYQVYMKKGSGAYKLATTTSSLSYKAKNLADGAKYTFKVVAYNGTLAGGEKASSAIYTLKKVIGVKVVKSGKKVKVSWKNIQGETGYQISKMTKKKGTQKKPTTYKTTKGKYKKLAAAKGKTYYYKVRAYKQVGKTKIYGPWSAVKKFKRK